MTTPKDHPPKAPLTPDVAGWLLALVNGLTLNAGAADFDDAYVMVSRARQQLQALAPQS